MAAIAVKKDRTNAEWRAEVSCGLPQRHLDTVGDNRNVLRLKSLCDPDDPGQVVYDRRSVLDLYINRRSPPSQRVHSPAPKQTLGGSTIGHRLGSLEGSRTFCLAVPVEMRALLKEVGMSGSAVVQP